MRVTDTTGKEVEVDCSTAKIHDYCNREGWVEYSANVIEDGKPTMFWTGYKLNGKLSNVLDRCMTWNNPLRLIYAKEVNYSASTNDPDKTIWNNLIKWASEHQDVLFDEYGDWKKVVLANPENGCIEIVKARGGRREGAGRKPSGLPPKKVWSVKVTDEEKEFLIKKLQEKRGE